MYRNRTSPFKRPVRWASEPRKVFEQNQTHLLTLKPCSRGFSTVFGGAAANVGVLTIVFETVGDKIRAHRLSISPLVTLARHFRGARVGARATTGHKGVRRDVYSEAGLLLSAVVRFDVVLGDFLALHFPLGACHRHSVGRLLFDERCVFSSAR